jgi:hypothetical protein
MFIIITLFKDNSSINNIIILLVRVNIHMFVILISIDTIFY